MPVLSPFLPKILWRVTYIDIYRILHEMPARAVSAYKLLTYQKSHRFLIQNLRVRKYRTKHFPCSIVSIRYWDMYHAAFRELLVKIIMRLSVRGKTSLFFSLSTVVLQRLSTNCLQWQWIIRRATKLFYSNFRTVVCFSTKIKGLKTFSRWMTAKKLAKQGRCKHQ